MAIGPDDVDMRWLVIVRIDDKATAVSPMDDDHV
jgi:hypothetical protein